MKTFLILSAILVFSAASLKALESVGPDAPYGDVTQKDLARLEAFAEGRGWHLKEIWPKLFPPSSPRALIDREALGQLFRFSVSLTKWDQNARTYGQLLACSAYFLWRDKKDLVLYSKVLDQQSPQVRQRVRDILLYPNVKLGRKALREAEVEFKKVFSPLYPAEYHYGVNDPLCNGKD